MKLVMQRVNQASCTVDDKIVGEIQHGYVILAGISSEDTKEIVEKMAKKAMDLRIFDDAQGKMNLSIEDVGGKVLSISQFTLYADCRKGRRPGFEQAAKPEFANELYQYFNQCIVNRGIHVEEGVFQAQMYISLVNDGPVTIVLDSKEIC